MHNTSIRDNHNYGNVGDYLKALLNKDCNVAIVSAYFTIYAYHHLKEQLKKSGVEKAITGSSNFTVNGLGLGGNRNIELNMIVDSDRDRQDLKKLYYV